MVLTQALKLLGLEPTRNMLIECISSRHDGLKISVESHIQNTDTHCTCTSIFAAESVDLYSFSQNTYYIYS